MARVLLICLSLLIFASSGKAENSAEQAQPQRVFQYTKAFSEITELMAEIGYRPANEQQVGSFEWSIDENFEYKWFCKPVGSSEIPYVMICVNPERQLNLLAQVDIYSDDITLDAPTYREEMATIAKNLKDVTQALKNS